MGEGDDEPRGGGGGPTGPTGDGPSASSSSPSGGSGTAKEPLNWNALISIIKERKIDFGMWVTRLMTLFFVAGYLLPLFGNPIQYYYKAFMATAATSALRLHQRLPQFQLSRAFFSQIIQEDSFHYLCVALIFLNAQPMTLALAPSAMFALLHFASFSLTLLNAMGRNNAWLYRAFISLVEYKTVTICRMAAGAEIFTLWFLIIYTILGRQSLLTPFVYFRFLTFRYTSRRNPYTRQMMYELRIMFENAAASPRCPTACGALIRKSIHFISKLAPPTATA